MFGSLQAADFFWSKSAGSQDLSVKDGATIKGYRRCFGEDKKASWVGVEFRNEMPDVVSCVSVSLPLCAGFRFVPTEPCLLSD